jgi:hypothetical protein
MHATAVLRANCQGQHHEASHGIVTNLQNALKQSSLNITGSNDHYSYHMVHDGRAELQWKVSGSALPRGASHGNSLSDFWSHSS